MTQRRYTSATVARARVLQEAGWSIPAICGLLERECGSKPQRVTVESWLDPQLAERRRVMTRRGNRRRRGPAMNARYSDDWKLEQMRELREAGLSFWAIGVVAGVWWGEPLAYETVARRLGEKQVRRRGAKAGRSVVAEACQKDRKAA